MKDVTFGQYYLTKSFVHQMDARVKILLSIAYIVAVFLIQEFHFLGFLFCGAFIVIECVFSRVPFFKVVGSIKAILVFVILSAVLQIFFNKDGAAVLDYGILHVTDVGLKKAAFIVLRIMLIVMGTSILTLTTTPVELSDGIESLLSPLKVVKFPVHEFALIMSIALRYIPTLLEETERIMKAQKARGADFENGGLIKRAKALIPILIPLLISSFRRADELADAMDARCYAGSKTRTRYKKLKFTYRDLIGLFFVSALIVGIVFLNKFYILLAVGL